MYNASNTAWGSTMLPSLLLHETPHARAGISAGIFFDVPRALFSSVQRTPLESISRTGLFFVHLTFSF